MLKEILIHEIDGIDEEALSVFVDSWNIQKNLKRNEVLHFSNEANTNIYFIKSGSLKVYCEIEGKEAIMSFGYPGTFLLDQQSIFSDTNSGFVVKAIKACIMIGIHKDVFYRIIQNNTVIAQYWQKRLQLMLLMAQEREVDLMISSPETRYARLLKRIPELFQNIPGKYIASYLRMTPETFSRIEKS